MTVFIDGREVSVPSVVGSIDEVKEALGVDLDWVVGFSSIYFQEGIEISGWALMEDEDGECIEWWEFHEGQSYASFPRDEVDWGDLASAEAVREQLLGGEEEGCQDGQGGEEDEDWGVVPDWRE